MKDQIVDGDKDNSVVCLTSGSEGSKGPQADSHYLFCLGPIRIRVTNMWRGRGTPYG